MSIAHIADHNWKRALVLNKHEKPKPEIGNALLLLTHDRWRGCLAYDEFGDRCYWEKPPPRIDDLLLAPEVGSDIADYHLPYVQHWFSRIDGVSFGPQIIGTALKTAARSNIRHPLREYLRGLKWDGENRLSRWCAECLGCEQTDYSAAVGTWWPISAVARALSPGEQVDHVLLLEGDQGARKSSALRILAGEWYLPELPDVKNKDAAHILHGRWICECGELDPKRSELNAVKDFLTRRVDVYRKPYEAFFVKRPRSIVFASTTNDPFTLNDPTGARRWWPISCVAINMKLLEQWRDQLWAESVVRYEAGEQWWPTKALEPAVQHQQEMRYQGDAWEFKVLAWSSNQRVSFAMHQILAGALGLDARDWNRSAETRVGAILLRAGYKSRRANLDGERVRVYEPKSREPLYDERHEELDR